ncbi:MAG: hypothetical protein IJF25_03695 [Oscillospiraceae bacterium]|nr:hypothetical protein [Oscillospiraceae bacterium]
MKRKVLSIVLAAAMIFCLGTVTALADTANSCAHHTHDQSCGGSVYECDFVCTDCVNEIQALVEALPVEYDPADTALNAQLSEIHARMQLISDATQAKIDWSRLEAVTLDMYLPPNHFKFAVQKRYEAGVNGPEASFKFFNENGEAVNLINHYGAASAVADPEPNGAAKVYALPAGTYTVQEIVDGDWDMTLAVDGVEKDGAAFTGVAGGFYSLQVANQMGPQINFAADPTEGGNVTGDSSSFGPISSGDYVVPGDEITLTATANTGYQFEGWEENGNEITGNGVDDVNNTYTFTISGDRNITAKFSTSSPTNPNPGGGNPTPAGGDGLKLEGPYLYESDDDYMPTEDEAGHAFEYGEAVYYLLLDDANDAPLSDRKYVEKLKTKTEWNMGGELVKSVQVIKKHISTEGAGAAYDCADKVGESGYYYFLEVKVADKLTLSESDISGVVEFNRKKDNKKSVAEIEDCRIEVDFSVFYPNNWNDDGGEIVTDRADIEWDTEYVFKFNSDDEVELSFGSSNGGNNEGTFNVDVSGQGKIYLCYTTDVAEEIAAANPGAKMNFLTFNGINGVGVKFNRAGEFTYEMEDGAYAYRIVDGKLYEMADCYDESEDAFVFTTSVLGSYVFSDTALQ